MQDRIDAQTSADARQLLPVQFVRASFDNI